VSQGRRDTGRRKGKEHEPNVPGQVFAPAKNHATIAIATTLECFSRRRTISPVGTAVLLRLRRLCLSDEGGHVVAVGRVGVH
jgi:hypothetical protein